MRAHIRRQDQDTADFNHLKKFSILHHQATELGNAVTLTPPPWTRALGEEPPGGLRQITGARHIHTLATTCGLSSRCRSHAFTKGWFLQFQH